MSHIFHITLKYYIVNLYLQIIRMLTDKCKNQESMLAEYEMREEQYQELELEADLLRQQMEAARWVMYWNCIPSVNQIAYPWPECNWVYTNFE